MPVAATVVVNFDGNSVKLQKELLQVERANRRAMKKISDEQRRAAQESRKNANLIKGALGGIIAALGVRELGRYADAWTNVGNRLRLVSKDAADLANTQRAVLGIAQDTRSDLTTTAELYTRMSIATKDLNASQETNLTVTRAVSQAAQLSGATTAQANAAVIQFTQGLAGGIFRAEEFNSVIENTPRLAQAMAEGLGKTIGELRQLVVDGELTADLVIGAVERMSGSLEAEFATVAPTIEQSLTTVQNATTALIGSIDRLIGSSVGLSSFLGGFAEGLVSMADNMQIVAAAADKFGGVLNVIQAIMNPNAIINMATGFGLLDQQIALTRKEIEKTQEKQQKLLDSFAFNIGDKGAETTFAQYEREILSLQEKLDELERAREQFRKGAFGSEEGKGETKIEPITIPEAPDGLDPLVEADLQLAALERLANDRIELEEAVQNTLLMNREAAREQFIQLAARQAEEEFLAALEARKAAHEEAGIPFTPEDELELLEEQGKRKVSIVQQAERERTKVEAQAARDREKATKQEERAKANLRKSGFNFASTLLTALAGNSKGAALAALAVDKGLAIAQTVVMTEAAKMRAMAELGPIAGPPVAAAIQAQGLVSIATIAATGLIEGIGTLSGGGGVGGGIGGVGGGVGSQNQQFEQTPDSQSQITIIIEGDAIGLDEFVETRVVDQLREAIDERDVVVFSGQSRQAEVARSG